MLVTSAVLVTSTVYSPEAAVASSAGSDYSSPFCSSPSSTSTTASSGTSGGVSTASTACASGYSGYSSISGGGASTSSGYAWSGTINAI